MTDTRGVCALDHSGLVMHRHWEAWNVVVHGSKRWYLYPPEVMLLLELLAVASLFVVPA